MAGASALQQVEQDFYPRGAEVLVERHAVEAGQFAQRFVGRAQRRQLMKARRTQGQARNGRAARHQQHVEAAVSQGARQGGGAAQMADAQKVLHVEEDARAHGAPVRGTLRRSTVTLPSERAVKK